MDLEKLYLLLQTLKRHVLYDKPYLIPHLTTYCIASLSNIMWYNYIFIYIYKMTLPVNGDLESSSSSSSTHMQVHLHTRSATDRIWQNSFTNLQHHLVLRFSGFQCSLVCWESRPDSNPGLVQKHFLVLF